MFYPGRAPSNQTWTLERCLETWGAWTAALVEAVSERWRESVARYQAGIRVILTFVSQTTISPTQSLGRQRKQLADMARRDRMHA